MRDLQREAQILQRFNHVLADFNAALDQLEAQPLSRPARPLRGKRRATVERRVARRPDDAPYIAYRRRNATGMPSAS